MSISDRNSLEKQKILIHALMLALRNGNQMPQLFETHISWVVVAGKVAYKLKKAVRLDFLDFSTLDARRFFCEEEVRLNRRIAPELYLGVTSITDSLESPEIDGVGNVIEYAVKMRAFPQEALWSHRIAVHAITAAEIDELADRLGIFHGTATHAPLESLWGRPEIIRKTTKESLDTIRNLISSEREGEQVLALITWENNLQHALHEVFENRKCRGFIRECHGDLHCGNILTLDGHVEAFDCIEFNEGLRWIDVLNDLAFPYMDLQCQGLTGMAAHLLSKYLAATGDYEDLAALRYYVTYRALVRCKVALLKAQQSPPDSQETSDSKAQAKSYLAFAVQSIEPHTPAIMITHGFSGSGKSTLARTLVAVLGSAVQIRSDVERKRLHGLDPLHNASAMADLVYSAESTRMTYERMLMLASRIVGAGYSVIVDAAFLRREERERFALLANELGAPFHILDLHASEETMRNRLAERKQLQNDPSDADYAVLEHQLAFHEGLSDQEMRYVTVVESAICADTAKIRRLAEKAGFPL